MIYLLVFLLIIELGLAYLINKYSFLSFTIISIGSFIITSVAYCIFFNIIGDDISLKCMILVISSMGFMMIGENIGKKIYIKNKYNIHTQTNFYYYATKKKMFMVFLGMLLIFCVRFYYLYKFSLKYGNENGVFGVLASARLPYALGEYSSSSLIEILAIYLTLICEIYSYLYLYYFLYNAILKKIILKRLLLPIIGYCIIAINFTGRTQYIQVATMIIWMMIYLYSQHILQVLYMVLINIKILDFTILQQVVKGSDTIHYKTYILFLINLVLILKFLSFTTYPSLNIARVVLIFIHHLYFHIWTMV